MYDKVAMWGQLPEVSKQSSTFPHKLSHINKPEEILRILTLQAFTSPQSLYSFLMFVGEGICLTFYKLSLSYHSACKIRTLIDVRRAAKHLSNLLIPREADCSNYDWIATVNKLNKKILLGEGKLANSEMDHYFKKISSKIHQLGNLRVSLVTTWSAPTQRDRVWHRAEVGTHIILLVGGMILCVIRREISQSRTWQFAM